MVPLDWSDEGPGTLTAKEPHRWVEGFPVLVEPAQFASASVADSELPFGF